MLLQKKIRAIVSSDRPINIALPPLPRALRSAAWHRTRTCNAATTPTADPDNMSWTTWFFLTCAGIFAYGLFQDWIDGEKFNPYLLVAFASALIMAMAL